MTVNSLSGHNDRSPCPRQVVFDLSHEMQQAVQEESQRWNMDVHETIQFILRWGWLEYFRR